MPIAYFLLHRNTHTQPEPTNSIAAMGNAAVNDDFRGGKKGTTPTMSVFHIDHCATFSTRSLGRQVSN